MRGAEQDRLLLQQRCRFRGSPAHARRRNAPGRSRRARSPAAVALPARRSDQRFLVKRSAARSMTALAAAGSAASIGSFWSSVMISAGRAELRRKVEDVAHGRGAERVDRLGVVADDGQTAAVGLKRPAGLRPEAGWCPDIRRPARGRTDRHMPRQLPARCIICSPVEQQVIVIEHVLGLLGLDITAQTVACSSVARPRTREMRSQHIAPAPLRR